MDDLTDDCELQPTWSDARKVLGDRLVNYLLGDVPEPEQTIGLPALPGIVSILAEVEDPTARCSMASSLLLQPDPDSDSLGNSLRRLSGGEIPVSDHKDNLNRVFATLLIYLFPGILAHVEENRPWWSALPQYSPIHDQCARAILDSDIGQTLYPGGATEDTGSNYAGVICDLYSTSHSGSLQLPVLIGNMVQYACIRMRLWGGIDLSLIPRAAENTVQSLRKLTQRKPVDSPCIFTLDGVRIDQEGAAHVHESGLIATPYGSMGFTSVPTRVLAIITRDPRNPDAESNRDLHTKAWQQHHADLHRARDDARSAIDRIRLAVILAARIENNRSVRPILGQWVVYSPLGSTMVDPFEKLWTHSDRHLLPTGIQTEMPAGEDFAFATVGRESFRETMDLCAGLSPTLDIGVSRIVRATLERDDPVDGFVDAIVCWENLVGAEQETSFRICASLAHLLHPTNPEERRDEYTKMKQMYVLRSKVVHGSVHLSSIDAFDKRDYAIDIALRAMREVLSRADLRSLKKGRSDQILLGPQGLEH